MELAVLVPVLNRPANVQPLVLSFLTSNTPGHLVFIVNVDDYDELRALDGARRNQRVDVIATVEARTWPEKINVGVKEVDAEWYLCAADDIEFMPGWWEATEALRRAERTVPHLRREWVYSVIGTNDLANPRVIAGEHSTHTLVRGSYIREHGTIDEKGKAVHDGYHHWYVDDELLWTARYRGVYAHCADAHINHHHPYFDADVQWDETYALGEKHQAEDQALFIARAPLFGV